MDDRPRPTRRRCASPTARPKGTRAGRQTDPAAGGAGGGEATAGAARPSGPRRTSSAAGSAA
eukprot:3043-Lingulodinium_polyedra.AAC.1